MSSFTIEAAKPQKWKLPPMLLIRQRHAPQNVEFSIWATTCHHLHFVTSSPGDLHFLYIHTYALDNVISQYFGPKKADAWVFPPPFPLLFRTHQSNVFFNMPTSMTLISHHKNIRFFSLIWTTDQFVNGLRRKNKTKQTDFYCLEQQRGRREVPRICNGNDGK